MSKKPTVNANSFQVKDSSVFHSGNFSAKYTKDKTASIVNDRLKDSTENVNDKGRSRSTMSDAIEDEDKAVQPLTIAGGFQNTPSSVYNDDHQLGVSLTKNHARRESLLSSSLSQSMASSRMHKSILTVKQSQTSMVPLWGENSPYERSPASNIRSQQQQQQQQQPPQQQQQQIEPAGTNYSSMKLQGGFIKREIEPWINDRKSDSFSHTGQQPLRRVASSGSIQTSTRSVLSTPNSAALGSPDLEAVSGTPGLSVRELTLPGAFRRNFILNRDSHSFSESNLVTRNFLEFLDLYDHFAGQDLEEDEEGEDETEDDDSRNGDENEALEESDLQHETLSLMRKHNKRKTNRKVRNAHKVKNKEKKVSTQKAFLLLLKAFLGTGIIFLPKAFSNGGLVFSNVMIVSFSLISYYCFLMLIKTTSRCKVSGYGDIGFKLFGKRVQFIILFSLVLSQLGFASTYTVFVCKNLQQVLQLVYNRIYALGAFFLLQTAIFVPISLTRSISKLGICALIADVFIFLGLIYIFGQSSFKLVSEGASDKVGMFKPGSWTLFIGTAVFTYVGIGLLIPIQESMKEPEKFNRLLILVMLIVTIIFTSIASISYLSYGDEIHTIILMDFPRNKITNSVQLLYSIAILLSTPIQLFPAIKIVENYIFHQNRKTWRDKIRRNSEAISVMSNSEILGLNPTLSNYDSVPATPNFDLVNQEGLLSGKSDTMIKTLKNCVRVAMVLLMCGVGYLGAEKLDKFVSLIGSLTCVPLIYIYPPLLYYKEFGRELSKREKGASMAVLLTGCALMAYTSYETASNW